jgi:nitroreductase
LPAKIPDPPKFGDALPPKSEPQVLDFLSRRRSASALMLCAPGPGDDEIDALLTLAVRVPDHGKLSPWRFIVMTGEAKADIGKALSQIAERQPNVIKANAALGKFLTPPVVIAVVSSPKPGEIPKWEQRLSAGAVCLTLLNAATAMGYGANWITDWYAYDAEAAKVFGLDEAERIAGFVYIGTPSEAPLERARPDVTALIQRPR